MVRKAWLKGSARMRSSIVLGVLLAWVPALAQQKAAPAPAAAPTASAAGGVFRCLDAEGKVEYRNVGDTKGCKRVETDSVTTVPFPRAAPARTDVKAPGRIEAGVFELRGFRDVARGANHIEPCATRRRPRISQRHMS